MKALNTKLLALLAEKPELISVFPEWMLSHEDMKQIRETDKAAIAEIAGRDSIAAVIRACETKTIRAIVPTLAYTGTEYGRWEVPLSKIKILKKHLKKKRITVFGPVFLGSPEFWWNLCGKHSGHFAERYKYFSPCIGCHLYLHAIRIPLAKTLNVSMVIGGERESHDERIKVNQTEAALDAYQGLMKKFNVELFLPLRYIKSGSEIESILGEKWKEGDEQLACVLSRNYQKMDGSVSFDESAVKRFLHEFALKKTEELIKTCLLSIG
jgi:hypothetical protein